MMVQYYERYKLCGHKTNLDTELLTLLGPQSRFGDKLLIIRVLCPHIWECGVKWVNTTWYIFMQAAGSEKSVLCVVTRCAGISLRRSVG